MAILRNIFSVHLPEAGCSLAAQLQLHMLPWGYHPGNKNTPGSHTLHSRDPVLVSWWHRLQAVLLENWKQLCHQGRFLLSGLREFPQELSIHSGSQNKSYWLENQGAKWLENLGDLHEMHLTEQRWWEFSPHGYKCTGSNKLCGQRQAVWPTPPKSRLSIYTSPKCNAQYSNRYPRNTNRQTAGPMTSTNTSLSTGADESWFPTSSRSHGHWPTFAHWIPHVVGICRHFCTCFLSDCFQRPLPPTPSSRVCLRWLLGCISCEGSWHWLNFSGHHFKLLYLHFNVCFL